MSYYSMYGAPKWFVEVYESPCEGDDVAAHRTLLHRVLHVHRALAIP